MLNNSTLKYILLAFILVFCHNAFSKNLHLSEKQCLGSAIWYEARGESVRGQRAVLDVVLNRSRLYDKTICYVVLEYKQFSFVNRYTKWLSEEEAEEVIMRTFEADSFSKTALYYHNHTVHPKWDKHMIKLGSIGHHLFYTDKDGIVQKVFDDVVKESRYQILNNDFKGM